MLLKRLLLGVLLFFIAGFIVFTLFNSYIYYQKNISYRKVVPQNSSLKPRLPPSKNDTEPTWTLLLTGDIIPARSVNYQMQQKHDFMWPLVTIVPILKDADVTLINLESPLIAHCPITNEGMTFCGDYRFAKSLADAGVDVANVANNHSLNYGWEALGETEKHLKAVGIETTGFTSDFVIPGSSSVIPSDPPVDEAGVEGSSIPNNNKTIEQCSNSIHCSKLIIKEITPQSSTNYEPRTMNLTIGFLGYNTVGQDIDREQMKSEIAAADALVDVLVVSVHWGKEYTHVPETDSIAPHDPKELGKLFVDWGADVVSGNHPHWYQGIEWYPSFAKASEGKSPKPIIYAQGNTIFDQEWSPETKVGYLAKITFIGDIPQKEIEITPIGLRNYGEVYLLEGDEAKKIKDFVLMN